MEMALTTNRNKPKVKIVRGNVINTKMGRTIALINPIIMAAIAAAVKVSRLKPGTILAVITKEIAATNQVSKNCGINQPRWNIINPNFSGFTADWG
jgi:hypothetical protein